MSSRMNNVTWDNLLFRNCRPELPVGICCFANVCGLLSTTVWFFVLLPQILYIFKRRSVEGLSFVWAAANFTASLNNTFFIFKWGTLPLYSQINAIYMPILEAVIIIQFLLYVPHSKHKTLAIVLCMFFWVTIIALQIFLTVYQWLEWVSITLWSLETFPQILLNFQRQSTSGLALGTVLMTTLGKLSDFFSTYLLIMPLQYLVMCYFSSSTAFVVTLQVVMYWKNDHKVRPTSRQCDIDREATENLLCDAEEPLSIDAIPVVSSCRPSKYIQSFLFVVIILTEISFAVGLMFRTSSFLFVLAPIALCFIVGSMFFYTRRKKSFELCE